MFKKLVARVPEVKTELEFNTLCGDTNRAFDQGKINWTEHELIYRLIEMIDRRWEKN